MVFKWAALRLRRLLIITAAVGTDIRAGSNAGEGRPNQKIYLSLQHFPLLGVGHIDYDESVSTDFAIASHHARVHLFQYVYKHVPWV